MSKRKADNYLESIKTPKRIKKNGYNIIDLYAGAGGFSEGFRQAGFNILIGIDNNQEAMKSYRHNFGKEAKTALLDIRTLDKNILYQLLGFSENDELDLIVAGPSCQSLSKANHNRDNEKDDRNMLIIVTAHLIAE